MSDSTLKALGHAQNMLREAVTMNRTALEDALNTTSTAEKTRLLAKAADFLHVATDWAPIVAALREMSR